MNIENQIIKVRVNNFNEIHFSSLGYEVKRNEYIEIPVGDLPTGSGLKIDVQCAYCKKVFKKAYRRYLETKDNLCCEDCKNLKMIESSLEKYGNRCSIRNPEILEKSKKTNMKKYGVEYPFQNQDILKKCIETSEGLYGKGYRGKTISGQQKTIHKLYDGSLNHSEFPYFLDIFFKKEKIYFEYDGSGHDLGVRLGRYTEQFFNEKEDRRRAFLKDKGYKEFRITSTDDILPSDNELLEIKERAFFLLLNENYNSYIYDLNTKTESFEE